MSMANAPAGSRAIKMMEAHSGGYCPKCGVWIAPSQTVAVIRVEVVVCHGIAGDQVYYTYFQPYHQMCFELQLVAARSGA